jgi:coronin-1B/1C/6
MASEKRQSKFRHVYGEPAKPEHHFIDVKNPLCTGEGSYLKCNPRFFAVAKAGGGGPLYIRRLDDPGRLSINVPMLSVHKGTSWDFDFHPFLVNLIATASEDCHAAVTQFPEEGLTETITKPTVVLEGHQKKVTLIKFNPTANNILATGSFDNTVKVWNVETASCISTFDQCKDSIMTMEWNSDGSRIACGGKDAAVRLFDPRCLNEAQTIADAFDGAKGSKVFWADNLGWIGGTGFSRSAKRQMKFWDLRKFEKPLYENDIDQAAGVLYPNYDGDNSILYLVGKGEGNINYYELVNDEKICYTLSSYRNTEPQKGGGWLPKRACQVKKCEVARFYKLAANSVVPISFIVPRKAGAEIFQEDIFPNAYAGRPALQAEDWLKGENRPPVTMTMNPALRVDESSETTGFTKKKTYAELEQENIELKERAAQLESQIAALSGKTGDYQQNDEEKEN